MNKTLKLIIFAALFLLMGMTASCNLPSAVEKNNTETPIASATSAPISTPSKFVPAASATPELAPLCELTNVPPAQCQIPAIEESTTFCMKKKPYNLIFIDTGLTYQVLTRGFTCVNSGTKGSKQIVTCTGQMAAQFEVNVCDPACIVPTVQASATQCPPDYKYNDLAGCCVQGFEQITQNCTVLKLRTTSCSVNCSVYTKKSTCEKNSIACMWNEESKICVARR